MRFDALSAQKGELVQQLKQVRSCISYLCSQIRFDLAKVGAGDRQPEVAVQQGMSPTENTDALTVVRLPSVDGSDAEAQLLCIWKVLEREKSGRGPEAVRVEPQLAAAEAPTAVQPSSGMGGANAPALDTDIDLPPHLAGWDSCVPQKHSMKLGDPKQATAASTNVRAQVAELLAVGAPSPDHPVDQCETVRPWHSSAGE